MARQQGSLVEEIDTIETSGTANCASMRGKACRYELGNNTLCAIYGLSIEVTAGGLELSVEFRDEVTRSCMCLDSSLTQP